MHILFVTIYFIVLSCIVATAGGFGKKLSNIILYRPNNLREAKIKNIISRIDDFNIETSREDIIEFTDKRSGVIKFMFIGTQPYSRSFGAIFEPNKDNFCNSRLSIESTKMLLKILSSKGVHK